MIHKNKKDYKNGLAYVVATASACISFLFWTQLVTDFVVLSILRTQMTVSYVNIDSASKIDEKDTVLKFFGHASADIKENVVALPKIASVIDIKSSFKAQTDENVEIISEEESVLNEWGITLSYYLSIPDIGVNTEVYIPSMDYWNSKNWDLLEKQMQIGLNEGAVAYPHSANAGELGTIIVAGHSSPPSEAAKQGGNGHLFANLPELTNGDKILIRRGADLHVYEIIGSKIVAAGETSILLQQQDESIMKLITCYPIGTTRDRYVITARLVEE